MSRLKKRTITYIVQKLLTIMARKNATKFRRRILSKNSSRTICDLLNAQGSQTNFQIKGKHTKQVFLETARKVRQEDAEKLKQITEAKKQILFDAKSEALIRTVQFLGTNNQLVSMKAKDIPNDIFDVCKFMEVKELTL